MKTLVIAALLLLATRWPATAAESKDYSYSAEPAPQIDSFATSKMEAAAVLGELKYQHGDLSGADQTFRESLDSSTKLSAPGGSVVGLDLYRTAELAARKKDYVSARKHLEILISRYPDSEWADKAERLLAAITGRGAKDLEEEDAAQVAAGPSPEGRLRRLQEALRQDRSEAALAACEDFLTRFPAHKASEELRLLEGLLRLRLKDVSGAARLLRTAAERAKDPAVRSKAVYLLAAANFQLGRYREVAALVPQAAPAKAWNKWLALSQAWRAAALEKQGQREQAAAIYKEVLDAGSDSPLKSYLHAARAAAQDRQGRSKEAQVSLRRAESSARRYGQDELAAASELSQAHLSYRQKNLEDAADGYGLFALRRPTHPQATLALYQQGLSLKRLDRRRDSAKAFETLVRLHPDSVYAADSHLQLGQLYAADGAGDAALSHYRKISDKTEALLLSAQVHFNQKRYKDAIPLYWEYLKKAPAGERSREVEDLLLTSYWTGDRLNPEMYHAAGLYPDHAVAAPILLQRAESLMKVEPRGAAAALKTLLARHPKSPLVRQARFMLASALFEAGDARASVAEYAKVQGQDALGADAAYNRALALSQSGSREAAADAYAAFLKAHPKHSRAPEAWFLVGETRQAQGRYNDAIVDFRKAGAHRRTQALFNIARCQESLKQIGQALHTYEQLRAETPANDSFRVNGLLRLGLLQEMKSPLKAMKLYGEVMRHSERAAPAFETARKRVQALSADGALLGAR